LPQGTVEAKNYSSLKSNNRKNMEVKFIYSYKTQLSSHNLRLTFRSVGEKTK